LFFRMTCSGGRCSSKHVISDIITSPAAYKQVAEQRLAVALSRRATGVRGEQAKSTVQLKEMFEWHSTSAFRLPYNAGCTEIRHSTVRSTTGKNASSSHLDIRTEKSATESALAAA